MRNGGWQERNRFPSSTAAPHHLCLSHSQQAVHVLAGGGDVVVVFAGQAQLGAVTLVHDVPQLFGGQRLETNTDMKPDQKNQNLLLRD